MRRWRGDAYSNNTRVGQAALQYLGGSASFCLPYCRSKEMCEESKQMRRKENRDEIVDVLYDDV